jgi:hypothetical protein
VWESTDLTATAGGTVAHPASDGPRRRDVLTSPDKRRQAAKNHLEEIEEEAVDGNHS